MSVKRAHEDSGNFDIQPATKFDGTAREPVYDMLCMRLINYQDGRVVTLCQKCKELPTVVITLSVSLQIPMRMHTAQRVIGPSRIS